LNKELGDSIREIVTKYSSAKKQKEPNDEAVVSAFNDSIVDADTLMAELYLVLLNFMVCFVNLLSQIYKEEQTK
jgi:hypothetical protein